MTKITILRGLPASGKTTWAKEQIRKEPGKWKRVNKDDLRAMIDNGKWSPRNEELILDIRDYTILSCIAKGVNVIVDDTNLAPKHIEHIRDRFSGVAAEIEVKDFHVDLKEAIERDLKRPNSVGEKVIRRMYDAFVRKNEKYAPKGWLDRAIMCDIDGTLALINGRNPYDASMCENDELNAPIAEILKAFRNQSYAIVLMSGRKYEFKGETERWLRANGIEYDAIYMRAIGDNRKDAIVKRELFDTHVRDSFDIVFALDDRNQVVDMWREIGLTCLQVAPGDF